MNESAPTLGWNEAASKAPAAAHGSGSKTHPGSGWRCGTCRYWKNLPGAHIGSCEWKPLGPLPCWLLTVGNTCLANDGRDCKAWHALPEPDASVRAPAKPVADADDSGVDHPRHYNAHPSGVECITVVEHFGFNLGNVIKYLWRAEEKGAPMNDLKKAAWYLRREILRREDREPKLAKDPLNHQAP